MEQNHCQNISWKQQYTHKWVHTMAMYSLEFSPYIKQTLPTDDKRFLDARFFFTYLTSNETTDWPGSHSNASSAVGAQHSPIKASGYTAPPSIRRHPVRYKLFKFYPRWALLCQHFTLLSTDHMLRQPANDWAMSTEILAWVHWSFSSLLHSDIPWPHTKWYYSPFSHTSHWLNRWTNRHLIPNTQTSNSSMTRANAIEAKEFC